MLNMEEELKIEFLTSRGYVRKKCPVCGEYFWTLDPDRETCGESPCEPYSFIGRGLPRKMSVEEVREGFLSFFERNGHTRVGRYPIIARWRDDLFLVSASIVDFQPFVTAGLVPPPANPLTISQPCVRLKDIDKVGLTMGRHLTIFEMMAHHAFNRPGEEIYWKERTVELFHRYAAEVLGVKEEEITYKEGLWSGGGNAGPDLEPIVGGLEVATLVFMEYRVLPDGKLERMDTRIVDTGYGLERIAWLSQGTPTAFDAIYGGLVSRFMDALGVEPPDSPLLSEYSRISSLMSKIEAGESLLRLRAAAASRLGMDPSELDSLLRPVEAVYSVLDHTKAIAFLLGDGLVPSNSKEGYLGRLIIRRALRLLRGLAEVPLADLVAMQLDYWAPQFPELREARSRILEIVEIEEERYRETMERGVELVRREIKKLKKRGEKKFPLEVLIELYDSHGVPPEVAAEVAASQGFSAEVPDNFYELVAARHEAPEVRPPEVPEYLPQLEKLPKTELIFYEDPYARSFEARVVGVVGGAVVLDRTAFYPEGGGQPSDVGYLEFDGRRVRVTSVEKVSERVLHRVEGEPPAVGTRVRGVIDWDRRISLMRHHTATHILLESAKRVRGVHVGRWGAQKGEEYNRLDVTHYRGVTDEELREIELLANRIVMEDRPVLTRWVPRDRAEAEYGFTIYQGGVVPDVILRIVEIEDFNVQACAGTHVGRTGEVGPIKILRARRIQDGVVRFEFSAGIPAVSRLLDSFYSLKEISEELGVPMERAVESFRGLLSEHREMRREFRKMRLEVAASTLEGALAEARTVRGLRAVAASLPEGDMKLLTEAVERVRSSNPDAVLLVLGSGEQRRPILLAAGDKASSLVNCSSLIGRVLASLGRGGGSRTLARGSVSPEADLRELERRLVEELERIG